MTNSLSLERLPSWKMWMFALGQFGWCLAGFGAGPLLVYFYMPPENGTPLFPSFIFQGAVLGTMTLIGLINASTRVFDAFIDPLIANLSDRNRSRFGRRRLFLAISALPTALFSFLLFVPPIAAESPWNAVWVFVCMVFFYMSISGYCAPYNALLSELGHTEKDRLSISTLLSVAWALGFALGNQTYFVHSFLMKHGWTSMGALQTVVGTFSLVGFVAMMLPVIFIDEKRYCSFHSSKESLLASLSSTFRNKNFRVFVSTDLLYFLGQNFIGLGMPYYVSVLLGLDSSWTSVAGMAGFLLSFAFYYPTHYWAAKFGKKKMVIFAFYVQACVFALAAALGLLPGHPFVQGGVMILAISLPNAILGILPNAIVGDIAVADGRKTGEHRAAMFFGARTFMMKVGVSLANLIFPSLLLLGKSAANPVGVRLSGLLGFFFCLLAVVLFHRFNEQQLSHELAEFPGPVSSAAESLLPPEQSPA